MKNTNLLSDVEMFMGLSDKERAGLFSVFRERRLEPGEVLFRQGDRADSLYIVRDGFLEVLGEGAGAGRILVLLGRGQSVGEMSLLDRGLRSATVRAADAAVVLETPFRDFVRMLERRPDVGRRVMRNVAADLSLRLRHHNMSTLTVSGKEAR